MQSNKGKKKTLGVENTQRIDTHTRSNKTKPNRTTNTQDSKKHTPIKYTLKGFFKNLVSMLATIFIIYSVIVLILINKVNTIQLDDRTHSESGLLQAAYVKNILLIGTDGRNTDEQVRSDSMILVSINSVSKEIIITSLMRDMYVDIPNYHYDKLNASYSYGGASLLIDTIEENLSIKVDDCIIIDFTSFISMVDSVDGIVIDVSNEEASAINDILISEVNEIAGDDRMSDLLSSGGKVKLNGKQALSYSRIRYVGNADFERTQRQRTVIDSIIDRLKTPNIFRIGSFANTTASEITSSMSTIDMYLLSLQIPFALTYDIVQQRIPADGTWYYDDVDVQSVIVVDFEQNHEYLEETIYNTD